MLFADNVVAGPWQGSGLGDILPQGFQKGIDYTCNNSVCFAVARPGPVDTAFKNLQRAINRWSGKGNFPVIAVDGLIGSGTLAALQKAGAAMFETLPLGVKQLVQATFAKSVTRESTAQFAAETTKQLNDGADKLESAGALPPPRQASPPSSPPVVTPDVATDAPPANVPGSGPAPDGQSNLMWWLLGGFAVVATAGVVTVVVLRRRRRTTAVMTPVRGKGRPGRRAAAY